MDPVILSAMASICAALIALWGVLFNRSKAEEFSLQLKKLDTVQQGQLTFLKGEVDRLNFIANSNYSKRVAVLADAYSKLAEIKLMMESFVVPLFPHSVTGNLQTLTDAASRFEELYRFCSLNAIYLKPDTNKRLMSVLGKVMDNINGMLNLANSSTSPISAWKQQARIVIDEVTPALHQLQDEVRKELQLDL